MATSVEHLFAEALELDNDNRLELAELLMGSIAIDLEIFAEQIAVSEQRLRTLKCGAIHAALTSDEPLLSI
ncbi:MAG: hypothetical protein WCJ14_07855 [Verrucomicrobiota bacterium]